MAYDGSLPRPVLRAADFVSAAAEVAGVEAETLTSPCRQQFLAVPRMVAMYLARMQTQKSLPQIGRLFGRDHTTVLYAIEKTTKQIASDKHWFELMVSINDIALRNARQRLEQAYGVSA